MVGLGYLPGGDAESYATAVSADGGVVVGHASVGGAAQAFIWTQPGGMVGLGFLPGGSYSRAYGVSGDGTVVVGVSDSDSGPQAFSWTETDGMVGLGDVLGGEQYSCAYGVSYDGTRVVGMSMGATGAAAIIWDAEDWSIRSVDGQLVLLGIPQACWQLRSACAISADGRTVVGYGVHIDGHT